MKEFRRDPTVGHTPRSGPEVESVRSIAKDACRRDSGVRQSRRRRVRSCRWCPQGTDAARRLPLPSYPACVRGQKTFLPTQDKK